MDKLTPPTTTTPTTTYTVIGPDGFASGKKGAKTEVWIPHCPGPIRRYLLTRSCLSKNKIVHFWKYFPPQNNDSWQLSCKNTFRECYKEERRLLTFFTEKGKDMHRKLRFPRLVFPLRSTYEKGGEKMTALIGFQGSRMGVRKTRTRLFQENIEQNFFYFLFLRSVDLECILILLFFLIKQFKSFTDPEACTSLQKKMRH